MVPSIDSNLSIHFIAKEFFSSIEATLNNILPSQANLKGSSFPPGKLTQATSIGRHTLYRIRNMMNVFLHDMLNTPQDHTFQRSFIIQRGSILRSIIWNKTSIRIAETKDALVKES